MSTTVVRRQLRDIWRSPVGLEALATVNHKSIGKRYLITAFIFFIIGGLLALTMLIQLSQAGMGLLSAELYNQFFTMHGTTMMFLFAVPVMEGIGIYIVPLMLGTRDAAFPRLNAFGYYVYLIAGITLYVGMLLGQAPDAGWFNYVPLAGPVYSPEVNIDLWATAITFLEIAALVAAVEIIVTIFRMRAPGMAVNRMPVFVWAILVMSLMIVFAMPPLMVGSVFLALDRFIGTHFYNIAAGGSILLWQHYFWFFGHPEVYIIAVPAFGMVSTIVPTFARRPIVAYLPVVLSLVTIGIISFGLWVHHMFTAYLSDMSMALFSAASMAIAIPSGVQVFSWLTTLYTGEKIAWKTPLLWVFGFVVLFVIGGITGIMVAAIPFDEQVHDSHFVTAHFHYVLVGGSVFPLIGALYYWFPKVAGRMLDECLGRWSFGLAFTGFNIAFLTLHYPGFLGMPRRVFTYMEGRGWETPMLITTFGGFILAAGFALTLYNVIISLVSGEKAPDNPWGAGTLEWATTSPPPPYNFAAAPQVQNRNPLWENADQQLPGYELGTDLRETIGTSLLDGKPEQRLILPGPSFWPLALAVAVGITFIGSIFDILFVPIGALLSFVALVGWHWPRKEQAE